MQESALQRSDPGAPEATRIDSLLDPRVDDYRDVRDADLRAGGRFVVEGRLNVRRLVECGRFRVRSLLMTPTAHEAMRDCAERAASMPGRAETFVAPQALLNEVVGYNMHRGCLAVADRGESPSVDALLPERSEGERLVVALDDLNDQENVGGVYRNAMAFGVDAVLLSPRCCDPLFRKALRVSMGGALEIPTARAADDAWPSALEQLRARGFELVALDPGPQAESIDALAARDRHAGGVVLVAGAEGPGLSAPVRELCDRSVRIPMVAGVDSLNVATSVAIALHRLTSERLVPEPSGTASAAAPAEPRR